MFSIPGQTLADWESDLETAIGLNSEHVSCYNLTFEEDTDFMKRHLSGELDADEDRDAVAFYRTIEMLETNGLKQYEISNYARSGFESLHNRAYWSGNDYLGLGPSAVSTIEGTRWKSLPDTAAYTNAARRGDSVKTETETLSESDRRLEAIALQLRTSRGISRQLIADSESIDSLTEQGILIKKDDRI